MVGFGSSLRKARRSGWEAAYFDYETHKLLLSQIEAVYEEEEHRQRSRLEQQHDIFLHGDTPARKGGRQDESVDSIGKAPVRDYREELFLESDSDKAFASPDDGNNDDSSLSTTRSNGGDDVESATGGSYRPTHARPFTLSYSHEATSSDEDEDDGLSGNCSSYFTFSGWTKASSTTATATSGVTDIQRKKREKSRKHQNRRSLVIGEEEEDEFYGHHGARTTAPSTFFLAGGPSSSSAADVEGGESSSLLNADFHLQSETASLLPPATPAVHSGATFYTFPGESSGLTPPSKNVTGFVHKDMSGEGGSSTASSRIIKTSPQPPSIPSLRSQRWIEQRKRERRLRRKKRRQQRAKRRRERERKVPKHISVAHAKARAITERFLGLLRAETEKVMLFAQSRLGELADTAGSLRFPSYEDTQGGYVDRAGNADDLRTASSYDYPLSDSGMHPSASSSDDEGTTAWTDTSEEDDDDSRSGLPVMADSFGVRVMSEPALSRGSRKTTPRTSVRKKAENPPEIKDADALKTVRRQIDHFTKLRNMRSVFQRNDQILGEDMLLISAVEEADGYTAIAVELMHVLRYICVNLIAVRKICRKHDRLLMQRQLGGYYHRARARGSREGSYSHIEDAHTLGGLLARVSGDIYEAHPALIGQMNHYKLVGVYDRKIQQMANSRTVQVVSSCLALALAEAEVTHSRADALTNLNSSATKGKTPVRSGAGGRPTIEATEDSSDDQTEEGPPSTASSVSLTRLRFAVTSIFALREAARYKLDSYGTYLSRCALVFTGQPVVGEGLDGCSRGTLDFFVSYNPDYALLLDSEVLFEGLKRGHWVRKHVGDVMISTLAVASATSREQKVVDLPDNLSLGELVVSSVISIAPDSKKDACRLLLRGQRVHPETWDHTSLAVRDFPVISLRLNRASYFLYTMNYFVVHATTVSFIKATGGETIHSALVIGAPCLSAILTVVFHCFLLTREFAAHGFLGTLYRRLFLLSAVMAVAGNVLHANGVNKGSVKMAVFGRFLFGFSSAEILHRRLLVACWPSRVVAETAKVIQFRAAGVVCGLFVGSLADLIPAQSGGYGVRGLQAASWLMVFLWIVQFIRIAVGFRPRREHSYSEKNDSAGKNAATEKAGDPDASESDSSGDELPHTPNSFLYRSSSDVTGASPSQGNSLKATYGATSSVPAGLMPTSTGEPMTTLASPMHRLKSAEDAAKRKRRFRHIKVFPSRVRKLLSYHVGIPIALMLLCFVNFGLELFFTASPVVTDRYFGWTGTRAGVLLGCQALTILPLTFVCQLVARRYEERVVMKRSIILVGIGLFTMINWVSLFRLASEVPRLLDTIDHRLVHPYDGSLGVVQYVLGWSTAFVGLVSLEGATLSLLSKVSPSRFKSVVINVGTIVTFLSLAARFIGDVHILTVGSSHKLINTDIVNALVIPLLMASFVAYYFVKKHFYFLM